MTTAQAGTSPGHAGNLRVQVVNHPGGRRSWVVLDASTGSVHARAERFLAPLGEDAGARDLCRQHEMRLFHARRRSGFDEQRWIATQGAFAGAGAGDCRVPDCPRRAETEPSLCPNHRKAWVSSGRPDGLAMEAWLRRRSGYPVAGVVSLAGLPPLLAAEVRYGLWAHTRSAAPARCHPMWLRRLVKSCREVGAGSLTEFDPTWAKGWRARDLIALGGGDEQAEEAS